MTRAGGRWQLRIRGATLTKEGVRLLSAIDLEILPGERLLVLGPNGAGKTLLMHVAHRLIAPTQGQVDVVGQVREAMVFQRPVLVWLDEPTANLEPASTQAIESIVTRMSDQGATCVMTTHDIGQARRLAQRVVLMAGGRIIESTEAARFFEQPATDAGRRYLRGELLKV